MPEGDILLRVARRLTAALGGEVLVRAELRWPDLAAVDLVGRTCVEVVSYGKHLLVRFDDVRTLHTHLRMDGYWRVRRTTTPPETLRDHRVRAVLATERWTCVGVLLGMMDLVRTADEHTVIGHLGPDLLADAPDLDRAVVNLREQGGRAIGEVLLDQRVAAGIGTIYLAETLWLHRVNPWRPSDEVPDPADLFRTAHRLMRRSADGPTVTATGDPRPGWDTHVHGREGRGCRRCRTPIRVGRLGAEPMSRPAFYCPTCQLR